MVLIAYNTNKIRIHISTESGSAIFGPIFPADVPISDQVEIDISQISLVEMIERTKVQIERLLNSHIETSHKIKSKFPGRHSKIIYGNKKYSMYMFNQNDREIHMLVSVLKWLDSLNK